MPVIVRRTVSASTLMRHAVEGKRRLPPDRSLTGKDEVTVQNGTYLIDRRGPPVPRNRCRAGDVDRSAVTGTDGALAAVLVRRRTGGGMTEVLPAQDDRRIALVDLLDRGLAGGVVISGEVVLSIVDVDMVVISLRTLVSSVISLMDDTDNEILSGQG
jgi:Gas vesicle protein